MSERVVARGRHSETEQLLSVVMAASGTLMVQPSEDEELFVGSLPPETSEQPIAGRWRHFKGGEYDFLTIVHGATDGPMVLYLDAVGGIWLRPASMIDDIVDHRGKRVRRFERTPASPAT